MFTARVWKNTGFNGINTPSRPSILEALTYTDFPALDILTDIGLDYVKLHGTQSDFENVDYVKVGHVYYKVFGVPTPLNGDTWQIPLVCDGVLTAGGITNIIFLDGIARRASVDEDKYGEYCLEDELLTPAEPLQLEINPISVDSKTIITQDQQGNTVIEQNPNWEENVFVETTIDLGLMACIDGTVEYETENGDQVLVPHSYPKMGRHTSYSYSGLSGVDTKTTVYPVGNNYDGKDPIQEGIQKCRALGIESAIFNQVSIPSAFVVATTQAQEVGDRLDTFGTVADSFCNFENPDTQQGETRTDIGKYNGFAAVLYPSADPPIRKTTYIFIREMQALGGAIDTLFTFDYDQTVKNKRILYGGNNKIGLLTTAGNRLESNPEELIKPNDNTYTSPRVIFKGDPHLNGSPYYRFEYVNGSDSEGQSFFFNAVKGLPWKKIPLVFSETSGNALNTVEFENSRRIADYNYSRSISGLVRRGIAKIGEGIDYLGDNLGNFGMRSATAAGAIGGTLGAGYAAWGGTAHAGLAATAGAATGVASSLASIPLIAGAYNVNTKYGQYINQKISEMSSLAIANNVSSPTVQISYDSEAFRDFYGEVLFTYRYKPTANDLARMDKLLTMYGYKICTPVDEINLIGREKFNYIEADVTIGGDHPMWLKDIIRAQLSAGCRLWHKKPSDMDYYNNPIRSNTP